MPLFFFLFVFAAAVGGVAAQADLAPALELLGGRQIPLHVELPHSEHRLLLSIHRSHH
jgi:hypothetical protein